MAGRSIRYLPWCFSVRFDIYGRFQLEIRREQNQWAIYRPGVGTLLADHKIVIPADLPESGITLFLNDMFHEVADGSRDIVLMP